MSKKNIIPVLLLCLLLSACGQMDIEHGQDAMNATTAAPTTVPTANPTTVPTTAVQTTAPTTAKPTTVPTTKRTTVPTTAVQTTAPTAAKPTDAPTKKQTTVPTTAIPTTSAATTVPTTGNKSSLPPPIMLGIRNAEEYNHLMQAVKDEQIYHETSRYKRVFRSHDELVAFVKLLEKLPSPQVAGAQYMTLRYYPATSQIIVEKVINQNHFYRFTFFYVNQENAANDSEILSKFEGRLDTEVVLNEQKNVTAITQLKDYGDDCRCTLNMDGWLVRFDVINKNGVDFTKQGIQKIFSVVTVEEKFEWR